MADVQLINLINTESPRAVFDEVQIIWNLCYPNGDFSLVKKAFRDTIALYQGKYPGFRAANTAYHDLCHATSTFLTMARLVHGVMLDQYPLTMTQVQLAFIAALWHDSGFIQEAHDIEGTGAKYTVTHVSRSKKFFSSYARRIGFTSDEVAAGQMMIHFTDLEFDLANIPACQPTYALLTKLMATADIIAQMSDRFYLEKLLFLYHEFQEGRIDGYAGEVDFLRKSPDFYQHIKKRLAPTADMTDLFLQNHFAARWNIAANLYQDAIEHHHRFLNHILSLPNTDPRKHLRRKTIVQKVRQIYGESE